MALVAQLLYLFTLAIFARAILSFFPIRPGSPIAPVSQFLYRITEPVLAPVRRVLPPMGGLDLSPLVVILGIQILTSILL
ncbi:MAG: YggT family protein [Acidimicrobiaceae bacterium]|jgi:YggT family protein|nr:YggT family protein [Ilumatobacteraceae bacterium]